MQHGVVLTASLADASSYSDLAAIADQATNIFNARYTFQGDRRALGAMIRCSSLLTNARLTAPTLRLIAYPEICPTITSATTPALPSITWWGKDGPLIVMNDEIAVQAGQTSGGALVADAGVWFEDAYRPPPVGQVISVKCTGAITAVSRAWTNGSLTFVQQLPAGRYACRGFFCSGTNLAFARLIFPNQPTRPMVCAQQNQGSMDWAFFRDGTLGQIGEFHTYAPPMLEVYAIGANTVQSVVLDLVRIGNQ